MNRPARVVFDCMVFLQGAGRRHGPARRCLELVDAGKVALLLSPDVLEEIRDVLARPELISKFPLITSAASEELLRTARQKATLVTRAPRVFSLPRDPDDEIYLALAIAGDADYLVTWNEQHLTYLMKQDTPEGKEFCVRFPKLRIVDPVVFLREMDKSIAEKAGG